MRVKLVLPLIVLVALVGIGLVAFGYLVGRANTQSAERSLQEQLHHARMMLGEAEGKVSRIPDSPDTPRLLRIIKQGKPIVERITVDYNAGKKSAAQLLKDLDEYKSLWR